MEKIKDDSIKLLYLYGTPALLLFCMISIFINIRILLSVYWIKRPLSPTLYISLSLAAADAFSSTALGIGLTMNSFLPYALGWKLVGVHCFLLGLEAIRLGGVMVTVVHLMGLAVNHYLGIFKPLHYASIMTHRRVTFLIILFWTVPLLFFILYFNLVENEGFQSYECTSITFLYHKKFRLLFSSLFFGPFILMVCIYIHIFYKIKNHQVKRLYLSGKYDPTTRKNLHHSDQQMMRNVKAVHTTLYILGSFFIGWMPGTIAYMLVCQDCILPFDWASEHFKFFTYTSINALIILKTLVNPIIYASRMYEIKMATKRMHVSICKFFRLHGRDPIDSEITRYSSRNITGSNRTSSFARNPSNYNFNKNHRHGFQDASV